MLTEREPPLWERVGAMICIVMLTGALIGPVFAPNQGETPMLRLIWLPVYAIIFGLIAARFDRVMRAWPAWLALLGLVILAYVSKYWSIDPAVTGRRVIAMAMTGSFALYLGSSFRGPHLPRLLMQTALLLALGSLVMVFAFPAIGVHQTDNAGLWRGLWYEKNQMGIVMVAGATAAAACLASGDPRRWAPVLTLVLTTVLVLATQSKTSLLSLMVGLGLVSTLWAMRRGGAAFTVVCVWLGIVMASIGVYIFLTEPESILAALGKDPSLTGRTHIWDSLMRRVSERPWTGYGYSAFWGRTSVPAAFVRQETGWLVPSAHNGWIDLLVQLGWPGALAVGSLFVTATLMTLVRLGSAGVREGYWAIAYLGVFLLLSLSESVLLSHASLPWTLFLAILARALTSETLPISTPLARNPRAAYQTRSRIAAQYVHGPARRPLFRL
ncbi:O-antigen ligase family protein [uncultured Brevundimonas sp.]|uniref:O-antigen ligase family protein n=1 Tax=uncultured Brevundimonas sp. TaxID=213418 RepID=UPI0030EE9F7B